MRTKLAAGITAITAVTIIGGAGVATAGASPAGARTEHLRSIVAVTAKNHAGRCTHVQAPATYQEITTATGTVSR